MIWELVINQSQVSILQRKFDFLTYGCTNLSIGKSQVVKLYSKWSVQVRNIDRLINQLTISIKL